VYATKSLAEENAMHHSVYVGKNRRSVMVLQFRAVGERIAEERRIGLRLNAQGTIKD
jgi:hypothetical protein